MNNCKLRMCVLILFVAFNSQSCDRRASESGETELPRETQDRVLYEITASGKEEIARKSNSDSEPKKPLLSHQNQRRSPVEEITVTESEKKTSIQTKSDPKKKNKQIIVGDAVVPSKWFENTSDHVREQILSWTFTLKKINGRNILGVVDENGEFITWPGAKEFPDGEYPEGYIFVGFDDDEKRKEETPNTVSF